MALCIIFIYARIFSNPAEPRWFSKKRNCDMTSDLLALGAAFYNRGACPNRCPPPPLNTFISGKGISESNKVGSSLREVPSASAPRTYRTAAEPCTSFGGTGRKVAAPTQVAGRFVERSWPGPAGGVRGFRRRVQPTAQAYAGFHNSIKCMLCALGQRILGMRPPACRCCFLFLCFPFGGGPGNLPSCAGKQTLRLAKRVCFVSLPVAWRG